MLDELLDVPNILGCNISEQDIQLISQCFDEIVKETGITPIVGILDRPGILDADSAYEGSA